MRYRRFGKTEIEMPVISCGGMRYNLLGQGDHWFPGENAAAIDEAVLRRTLDHSPFADRVLQALREAHDLLFEAPVQRLSQS